VLFGGMEGNFWITDWVWFEGRGYSSAVFVLLYFHREETVLCHYEELMDGI